MPQRMRRREFLRLGAAFGLIGLTRRGRAAEGEAKPVRLGIIGVGARGTSLLQVALDAGVAVPALCDINEAALARGIELAAKARDGKRPEGYSKGPKDYQRMLTRDDLDAVLVATPMPLHAAMSVDALRAGKHVLSEVAAAMTLDDCWALVRAAEETRKVYMLAENCCYWYHVMLILNLVQKGLFGDLTFAECGYVHDCRELGFQPDGSLTWRGELARDRVGNLYPTHSLGPVAQWLGINRGDRLISLVAMDTRPAAFQDWTARRLPEGHPGRQVRFRAGDSTTVLLRTANGAMIDLRYDIVSARPHPTTTYYSLQGLRASYDSRSQSIWVDGRTKDYRWEPLDGYMKEFEHPLWTQFGAKARSTGHDGADFFPMHQFLQAVRTGGPPPIDAADAAAWSSIIPLSAQSLAEGGKPQEVPDFTNGSWKTRRA
jgi:predicted dehydrogenase